MKHLFIVAILAFATVGCQSIQRLTEGSSDNTPADPLIIRGGQLGPTPTFNVPTPAGTTRVVIHQFLPSDGVVGGLTSSLMHVFIKDDVSGQWFILGTSYSQAFYYTYTNGSITVHGNTLSRKEICIYEYIAGGN